MDLIISSVAVLITFGLVIFLHEFGHFLVCVKLGVRVERFAFGFGPELIGVTRGDTRFSICAIPLGGFVKPAGESLDDATGDPDEYFSRSPYERLAIVAAGPAMNYILAFFMFFSVAFFIGTPEASSDAVLGDLAPDYPAQIAGLEIGDRVTKVDGVDVKRWEDLAQVIHRNPDNEIMMVYERDGKVLETMITPRLESTSGRGMIGIVPEIAYTKVGFVGAAREGVRLCWHWTAFTVTQLAEKIYKREKPDLAGPVGIVQMVSRAAHSGIADLIFLIGLISVAIGFFNILPIPLLDGGHAVLYIWEAISRKPLTTDLVGKANTVGLAFLLSLLVFATWNDISRIRDSRRAKKEAAQAAEKPPEVPAVPAKSE